MDLDKLKGKPLDDEAIASIQAHIDGLSEKATQAEAKARKAAKDSGDGAKAIKAERDAAFAKLGIESADELDDMPDAKGQADAAKQFEKQIKKLQTDLATRDKELGEVKALTAAQKRESILTKAISKHSFIDADDAAALLGLRVKQDGEDFLFDSGDGKLVPVEDGAAWLAKTKPHLVKAASGDNKGSNYQAGNKSSAAATKPLRKDFTSDIEFAKASASFHHAETSSAATH